MPYLSGAEVAKHATQSSCWIVLHSKVWDVTDFLDGHPGGATVISRLAGQDATTAYSTVHNPSLVSEHLPPSACLGTLDPSTTHDLKPHRRPSSPPKPKPNTKKSPPPLFTLLTLNDFPLIARTHLPPSAWAYYASGAGASSPSTHDPARLYRLLKLRPRILRDVSSISTSSTVLGFRTSMPVYVSPTGLAGFAHSEAECAIARVAGREGLVQVVPTRPTRGLGEVREAGKAVGGVQMFQMYVPRQRREVEEMVRRVERWGYAALWVTVDSPVLGKRVMDERVRVREGVGGGAVAKRSSGGLLNPGLTWELLEWVRCLTKLPVVVKGVQSVEDAVMAYDRGYAGVVLSNHGGRSLDTAQAPIVTLLEIRRYAPHLLERRGGRRDGPPFEVYVDGGIRSGTDVIKALALGATAVGVGRPFLYSMCAGYGEEGIRHLVSILRDELETSMALVGASRISDLVPDMVNSKLAELEVMDGLTVKL